MWDGAHWWAKPYASSHARAVLDAVPDAPVEVLRAILDFCVHTMSPADAGALLVLQLDADRLGPEGGLNPALPPTAVPRLPLRDVATHAAVRQLLAQIDGAAILDAHGDLLAVGAHLRASPRSHEVVQLDPTHGTRHASARRFSFDHDRTVVFVVSNDGPVTVYSDGAAIASIRSRPDEVEPDADPSVAGRARRRAITCPACGKRLVATATSATIGTSSATVACPVCGKPLRGLTGAADAVRVEKPRQSGREPMTSATSASPPREARGLVAERTTSGRRGAPASPPASSAS